MELAVFSLFASLAVTSALVVVSHRDPVKSTMSLVATLFSIAVLFVLLGAPFIATVQILVYAGAILVLFLFVVMLLNIRRELRARPGSAIQRWLAIVFAVLFVGMLSRLLWSPTSPAAPVIGEQLVSLHGLAQLLFSRYLLQFEIVGLLLLAAVVAASLLARRPAAVSEERPE